MKKSRATPFLICVLASSIVFELPFMRGWLHGALPAKIMLIGLDTAGIWLSTLLPKFKQWAMDNKLVKIILVGYMITVVMNALMWTFTREFPAQIYLILSILAATLRTTIVYALALGGLAIYWRNSRPDQSDCSTLAHPR